MKYNVFFKGIALLLCAVSLLGIVTSSAGIFCMAEGGLYNRTVEDMVQETVQMEGEELAQMLAKRYASTVLGGMPESVVDNRYPFYGGGLLNRNYTYAIVDAEGNLLEGETTPESVLSFSFPVGGKYMHLVSLMTEEEKFPSRQPELPDGPNVVQDGNVYLYNAVPSTGAPISRLSITYENGDTTDFGLYSGLGNVYYADGSITGLFPQYAADIQLNAVITRIAMNDADDIILYEAACPDGVGYFKEFGADFAMFISTLALPTPVQETVPETMPETVPETVAETEPETLPPPTVPEPTVPEVKVEITDRIPESGMAEITELSAVLTSGSRISHRDEGGIGRLTREDTGKISFTAYENLEMETGSLTRILFRNAHGEIVFEAACAESFAELRYNSNHRLAFSYTPPAPRETVPETVPPTTVPPTTVPPTTVPETTAEETVPETFPDFEVSYTMPLLINGKPLDEYERNTAEYFDSESLQRMYAQYVYTAMPDYTVKLYLTEDSFSYQILYEVLRVVQRYQQYLLPVLGGSLLVFLICIVYLFFSAGHSQKREDIRAGLLNRIPLDLYLGVMGLGAPALIAVAIYGTGYLLPQDMTLGCACAASSSFFACLIVVGFLFASAAQFKTPGGFWWRNTLCGHTIRLAIRVLRWAKNTTLNQFLPWIQRICKAVWRRTCKVLTWFFRKAEKVFLWAGIKLSRFLAWIGNCLHRFLTLLPVTWQWLVIGFLMFLLMIMPLAFDGHILSVLLFWGICIALIVYGSHCFGTLLDAAKNMRQGDLHHKVHDRTMIGSFQDFAEELNALAGVAMLAAQKQLKSERMKTELITNVSHDIKTPLTSIINYVDLLQKPHSEEEGEQYLEVLSRQSQQLKKLIEDLMDMSKASTGNMNVEITCVDAVESINQALGEFADKLDKAQISPVFRHSKDSVPMMADGRLVWRVLSNLLGNAIKYAMPGTRLYVDLMELDGSVVISMKNISREELSIDADELMERFVRGDGSRNTEGSGLGLNIAKSLMELQKGQMQILVDGDLFKVTLNFPGV